MNTTLSTKIPLAYEELRDVIDLSLWAGQLLLQNGAESRRIEETIHHVATGLGCDWVDILVSPNVILLTTSSGAEFRTKVRRVVRIGVDMTTISAINNLARRIEQGELDRVQVRAELERISQLKSHYNRWRVVGMVGLSCGAFSQLFGGDVPVFLVTFAASAIAMFVRQELAHRHYNPFLIVIVTAFVAGVIASIAPIYEIGNDPTLALAASVLLLVPGVPLINSAGDLIEGHLVMGIARGINGALIALSIAIGLSIAMWVMGVSGV